MPGAFVAADITGGYGKAVVVEGVSVRLEPGELVALVGPNGSGKSTLVKTIIGLATRFRGTVTWDGKDVTDLPPQEKARIGIGYVPQVDNVFPDLSVEENLEMGFYFRGGRRELERALSGVFEVFPVLAERRRQLAATLSGGERQMLAVARALMASPQVLLLDEPTAALAPKMVFELFRRIQAIRASGVAILMVEQHARKALEIADRGYVLVTGKAVMEGGGAEILAREDLKRAFLGQK